MNYHIDRTRSNCAGCARAMRACPSNPLSKQRVIRQDGTDALVVCREFIAKPSAITEIPTLAALRWPL